MHTDDIETLRRLNILQGVKESTFGRIITPSFLQSFPAGTVLLRENTPADFLYIVLEGLVEMSAASDSSETVTEILGPVNLFILAAVLNDNVCLQSARTLTPARILMIPAPLIRELLGEDQNFMRAVVFELARAYRRTVKELKKQKLRSGAKRLANWILREYARQEQNVAMRLPFEKRVLASYLGMTPENLSRGFATLAQYGVQASGGSILLSDLPALTGFANPSPLIDGEEPTVMATRGNGGRTERSPAA
ncbi:cyclic nucleotide-binding domain-containing protein [Ciceribacter thiooxidans]|uniref:Cyclic nucleotide-binding domain-containing protein n=1 Tax=Ciceribacter thiooxidans TaxID=1969821 RepID=A0ABV7I7Q3_9HYPH|nr:cyclic nucleotide-binding domain-containing protein [Ciceribacter thiooxidans]MDI6837873.1 cyclic nucleotide-binding domain-containing protein [Rhizobiaceae bacterium]